MYRIEYLLAHLAARVFVHHDEGLPALALLNRRNDSPTGSQLL